MGVTFYAFGFKLISLLGISAIPVLLAICALIFLLATEPERRKPWLKAMIEQEMENSAGFAQVRVDPVKATRFGIASGGLWILAVGLFFVIGFAGSWLYSWLVFVFALAIQVFMVMTIFEKKNESI